MRITITLLFTLMSALTSACGSSSDANAGDAATDATRDGAAPDTTRADGAIGEACDGLDNDGDGRIDNGCACMPGDTQPCYAGAPAQAGVGACVFGTMRCSGDVEFASWDEAACVGAGSPSAEIPGDGVDQDCDGSDALAMDGGVDGGVDAGADAGAPPSCDLERRACTIPAIRERPRLDALFDSLGPDPIPLSLAVDCDDDGVPNERDNCVGVANADQADGNGDGVGDACAADQALCEALRTDPRMDVRDANLRGCNLLTPERVVLGGAFERVDATCSQLFFQGLVEAPVFHRTIVQTNGVADHLWSASDLSESYIYVNGFHEVNMTGANVENATVHINGRNDVNADGATLDRADFTMNGGGSFRFDGSSTNAYLFFNAIENLRVDGADLTDSFVGQNGTSDTERMSFNGTVLTRTTVRTSIGADVVSTQMDGACLSLGNGSQVRDSAGEGTTILVATVQESRFPNGHFAGVPRFEDVEAPGSVVFGLSDVVRSDLSGSSLFSVSTVDAQLAGSTLCAGSHAIRTSEVSGVSCERPSGGCFTAPVGVANMSCDEWPACE